MRIGKNERKTIRFNSHLYEQLRKKYTNLPLETRRKLSDAHKGKPSPNKGKRMSDAQRKKLSNAHKGKSSWNNGKSTPEDVRKKLSDAKRGKNHPNYGKHLSEETRRKIAESMKRKHLSVHKDG